MRRVVRKGVVPASAALTSHGPSLGRREAQRILNQGHHIHQCSGMERVATALGCSGPNRLYPHYTASPLSSASLLANAVRNRILRNLEHLSAAVIRRTLDYVSDRHPAWVHRTDQETRRLQCDQVLDTLTRRRQLLQLRLSFDPRNVALGEELATLEGEIERLKLVREYLQGSIQGNLHPASLQQGEAVFLTPSEAAALPSPSAAIRGIWIRIAGARRGTRCMVWQKSAGRISTNSVGFVTAEEAKVAIPSKLGIYGLTVRIVYGRRDRLVNAKSPLNILDAANFTFYRS